MVEETKRQRIASGVSSAGPGEPALSLMSLVSDLKLGVYQLKRNKGA